MKYNLTLITFKIRISFLQINIDKNHAFTILEIITTLVIILILCSIAIPNYNSHLLKIRRSEAKYHLLNYALTFEEYYNIHNTYYGADHFNNINNRLLNKNLYYVLSSTTTDNNMGFILTATAAGTQMADKNCIILTINHLNQKHPYSCW